jgi:hypothetical protein
MKKQEEESLRESLSQKGKINGKKIKAKRSKEV